MKTPNSPEKTGSIVMITAARAGETSDCAHVCTKKAAAVAKTAVSTAVPQTKASGGSVRPSGTATINEITATVAIWSSAKP